MSKSDRQRFLWDKAMQVIAESAARRMAGLETDTAAPIPAVSSLLSRAGRAVLFSQSDLHGLRSPETPAAADEPATHSIEALLQDLSLDRPPPEPRKQVIHGGVFFAAHLLYSGWWTRTSGEIGLVSGEWAGSEASVRDIRRWLNLGYEQWGPSWSLWNPRGTDECLFGQIGSGDEANSLPVIVAPEAAAKLQSDMGERLAAAVVAKGTLYHINHKMSGLSENIKKAIRRLTTTSPAEPDGSVKADGMSSPYYFVVSDFEADGTTSRDFIEIDREQPAVYSAYMWHCLIRASDEALGREGTVPLQNVIFIWEHTNLMSRDCLAFNHDGLLGKKRYLEKQLGEQKLLQLQRSYSMDAVLGEKLEEPLVDAQRLMQMLRATHDVLALPDRQADILPMRRRS